MFFALISMICVVLACVLIAIRIKKTRERLNLEQHSISPEDLHELRASDQDLYLVDVRLPLDLLADSEIIPGAIRIDPKECFRILFSSQPIQKWSFTVPAPVTKPAAAY